MSIQPAVLLAALSARHPVSGNELALRLGVTRAAVWKQIESLRALGAPIEAAAGRGYRLAWPLEPLDGAAIRAGLDPALRKRLGDVQTHWQIDSTSSALLRHADAGGRDLSVCIAEGQSAGRGRRGRDWVSPLGGNVYFSLLKRFAAGMGALSGLSLVAGVALVQALADCAVPKVGLKWPNDVLADGRKLAGILVELGGEFLGPCHAVIGVGINVRITSAAKIGQPSIDLATLCSGAPPARNLLIARLLTRLVAALDRFDRDGFAGFRAEFARHDLLAGHAVRVHAADGMHDGMAEGVDARGALRVRHGGVAAVYDSAEVSVRSGRQ
jgi:BirA family biotin operon repressor/biotin-[acetyl-CoA-carboxylase] ligase